MPSPSDEAAMALEKGAYAIHQSENGTQTKRQIKCFWNGIYAKKQEGLLERVI